MRDLSKVLDSIIEIAPEFQPQLDKIKYDCNFTAPEAMYIRWRQAYKYLVEEGQKHPRNKEIEKIFSGN
jgi:ubiquinone/menaquinone biosynthesis C-methylase UbiE